MAVDYTDQSVYSQSPISVDASVKHKAGPIRQAQILDAASRCIAKHGFERATMDDIARAADLSKGSLYWHYKNKSAILQALLDRFAEEWIGLWQGSADLDPSLEVVQRGQDALQAIVSNRSSLETWIELLHHSEARDGMNQLYADVRKLITRALGRRSQTTSTSIVALFEGLLVQATIDPSFNPIPAWRRAAPRILGLE